LAVAGVAIAIPVVSPASAQVTVETPAGDVRVGHDRAVTATVGITGTAITDATLSPSAATTDLSVELGAATKYRRRTTARAANQQREN
jgi:hypothetical protein